MILLVCAGLAIFGCGGDEDSAPGFSADSSEATANEPGPVVEIPDGDPPDELVVEEISPGDGRVARPHDEVTIQYVGRRWDGQSYSNSWSYRSAPSFDMDEERLGPGLDEAVIGMREGERRKVIVPTDLIYYPGVDRGVLGPDDTLVFIVDLLKVKPDRRAQS